MVVRQAIEGHLSAQECYTKRRLLKAMGIGSGVLKRVRDAGAKPLTINGRDIYFGDEVIAALRRIRDEQSNVPG